MSVEGYSSAAEKTTALINALWRWRSYMTIGVSWALIAYLMVDNKALHLESKKDQEKCGLENVRLLERVIEEKQKSITLLEENKRYVESENDRLRRNQTNNR